MAKKIFLSPSNQTNNIYASGNTTEAVQCGRIAEAAAVALKRCGFEVKTNHYGTMAKKVAESNSWGADLHVPIHTNAYNGKVSGTRIFSFNTSGAGYKAAKDVFDALAPVTPGKSENVKAYPGLYEIKYANAPTVYVEAEFHDVVSTAAWIIAHVVDIGEAICKGICSYYSLKYVSPEKEKAEPQPEKTHTEEAEEDGAAKKETKTYYRVIVKEHKTQQLGAFSVERNATNLVNSLKDLGITWVEIEKYTK